VDQRRRPGASNPKEELDVRQPAWIALEKVGAVSARDRKVYVSPELSDVLHTVALTFPAKYTTEGRRK
jgi:hypothetical protein